MKKFLKVYDFIKIFWWVFGFLSSSVWASDSPSIGELHPPVLVKVAQQNLTVFFLKNNLKSKVEGVHVADAEVFYFSVGSVEPKLKYVWKIEGDEIASVFFYDWKTPSRLGKSMYVLTKSKMHRPDFEGFEYSVIEFPIIKVDGELTISFFKNDLPDPTLENCIEGHNIVSGESFICSYKDAGSVKKYLAAHDN